MDQVRRAGRRSGVSAAAAVRLRLQDLRRCRPPAVAKLVNARQRPYHSAERATIPLLHPLPWRMKINTSRSAGELSCGVCETWMAINAPRSPPSAAAAMSIALAQVDENQLRPLLRLGDSEHLVSGQAIAPRIAATGFGSAIFHADRSSIHFLLFYAVSACTGSEGLIKRIALQCVLRICCGP
jgi:hypothetical protein